MALIRMGSRGESVKTLQQKLIEKGYKIAADGIFGKASVDAVKDLQAKNGLPADGIVGPNTLKVVDKKEIKKPVSKMIRMGSTGDAVKELQNKLNTKGYSLIPDGSFGLGTDFAVKDFQAKSGLVPDGIVGGSTILALDKNEVQEKKRVPLNDNKGKGITEQDIVDVAIKLGVEVPAIKAVYEIESSGDGFLKDDRPKILFEGHIFWRELKKVGIDPKKHEAGNEDILFQKWDTSYYRMNQYERLERAVAINKTAAYASASWGAFQIMGFNYKACGFANVLDFVDAQHKNEGEHLRAFAGFIKSVRIVKHLKTKNWAAFAKGYNGAGFAKNKYDIKLAASYEKHKRA